MGRKRTFAGFRLAAARRVVMKVVFLERPQSLLVARLCQRSSCCGTSASGSAAFAEALTLRNVNWLSSHVRC